MGHDVTCGICDVTMDRKDRPSHVCAFDDMSARIEALEEEVCRLKDLLEEHGIDPENAS